LKIDPYAYLSDVFTRLPRLLKNQADSEDPAELTPLLPDHWLAAHPENELQQRTRESTTTPARRRNRRQQRPISITTPPRKPSP